MITYPIVRGREFLPTDGAHATRVMVINETAARRLFPSGDALGKRVHWGSADGPLAEIVGIAHDADYVMPGETPYLVQLPEDNPQAPQPGAPQPPGPGGSAWYQQLWDSLGG